MTVIPLRRFPAFVDLADALDSFHRLGWRPSTRVPPVDATDDPDVDVTLAFLFERLVRLETLGSQTQLLILAAEQNERHAGQIAAAAADFGLQLDPGYLRAGDVHRRTAVILRGWIEQLQDAVDRGDAA